MVQICFSLPAGNYSPEEDEVLLSLALLSVLLSDGLLSEALPSDFASVFLFLLEDELTVLLLEERLSVLYQPEPLKIMPAGWMTRRTVLLLHSGQRLMGLSSNFCWRSNTTPQFSH